MQAIHCSIVRNFFATAVFLGASLGCVTPVFATWWGILNPDGSLTYLDSLGGPVISVGGINDAGQVVGTSYTADDSQRAFITGPNGVGMRDLGTLGGAYSHASGINDAGQVVGRSYTINNRLHSFITAPNGVEMRDLGTLGGAYSESYGLAINDVGQVVGKSASSGHAFITGPNGVGMRDLGTLASPAAINNTGQVVISYRGDSYITGPDGVGMRGLRTPGDDSFARDINDAGQVVGRFDIREDRSWHAFITGPNGVGMRDLSTLGGDYTYSDADGINDAGQVVGASSTTADYFRSHAFVTGPNGVGMTDLNSLVNPAEGHIRIERAWDINDEGRILVSVVPEPETYAMLLGGLALVSFVIRLCETA
jgi:probable HAF family extracellular repeat protein